MKTRFEHEIEASRYRISPYNIDFRNQRIEIDQTELVLQIPLMGDDTQPSLAGLVRKKTITSVV